MYKIESYVDGTLGHLSLNLFKRKLRKDRSFRKKVKLYEDVDIIMKGALLATTAKREMMEKRIDIVTAGFVKDFFIKKDKPDTIKQLFNWS